MDIYTLHTNHPILIIAAHRFLSVRGKVNDFVSFADSRNLVRNQPWVCEISDLKTPILNSSAVWLSLNIFSSF